MTRAGCCNDLGFYGCFIKTPKLFQTCSIVLKFLTVIMKNCC